MKQSSLFSILCFVLCVASVSAQQQCMNNGNFTPKSTYDSNLRQILSYLPSNVTTGDGFFYSGSIGKEPNRVFTRGMCIPVSTSDDCSVCIKTASDGLLRSCRNQEGAFTWPGEPILCHVRYSGTFFDDISTELYPRKVINNTGDINSNNQKEFTAIWEGLMGRMIITTSNAKSTPSSSSSYYTADVAALTPSQNIYALMQCTPDLTSHSRDCESCLRQNVGDCGQEQVCIVIRASCFFRWDLKKFSKAFENITLASPPPPPLQSDKRSKGAIVVFLVPIVVVVFIIVIFVLLARRYVGLCWRRKKTYQDFDFDQSGITTVDSLQFDLKTIKVATKKFSDKLGQGGFGEVFKGTLPNGIEVAVKRLSKASAQGEEEFKNEVLVVAKLQHRNLVRLFGFCLEGEEKILVYEFVPNKSLDYFLFDPTNHEKLDWRKRYNIIEGIARGILYLHQDSRLIIIHRDLKASNILLDADMNPKIADFGMARIFGMDQSGANTNKIVGTRGYMPPEYVMQGLFSMKSDVYSFGVLVLEIICGQNNRFFQQSDTTTENFVTYAWRLWKSESPLKLVDSSISDNFQNEEVTRCIHIALLCVQKDPKDRPTLSEILLMLTSDTIDLPDPQPPGFFFSNRRNQLREGLESSQCCSSETTLERVRR
ncbi:PREDICTED: cysteine-rich receptor-like protein kinase 11 isoform X2 [Camelina sativa]|uniref:Cysteine-rich receptor-like protein kinase 11 isoform X2 n=1 Tax=Camelina sativa TaxID=90675 RepID=A0ABM0UZW8_CAMSA|nr:PREDICTED: cysteine-rich receptor-like protein kinase 11 isoform X2 [Camelina sativa]